jgi:hypothetical protein
VSSKYEFGNVSRVIRVHSVQEASSTMTTLLAQVAAKHPEWSAHAATVYVVGRDGGQAETHFLAAPVGVIDVGDEVVYGGWKASRTEYVLGSDSTASPVAAEVVDDCEAWEWIRPSEG